MNVLFTCAGRRGYLIEYFQAALAGSGRVLACDTRLDAPALQVADIALRVPEIHEPGYQEHILEICMKHQVRLLFSLNDLELPQLARNARRFLDQGTIPVVSSPEVIDICFDKLATARFLADNRIPGPRTFGDPGEALAEVEAGRLALPLVIKPRWGSASIGVEVAETEKEVRPLHDLIRQKLTRSILSKCSSKGDPRTVIVQERLLGQEYHLDVVNDLQARYRATFAKKKLAMRAGETDKAESVDVPSMNRVGRELGERLRHLGMLDVDVFLDGERPVVLEMNPRFGGGYPFSQMAGADVPAAFLAWARGEEPDPSCLTFTPGIASMKADRLFVLRKFKRDGFSRP